MRGRPWRRLRAQVLADNLSANQGLCTLAIPKVCTGRAQEVHHQLGISTTGHDPRYLVAVCRACNLHVGDPTAAPDPPHRPITAW